MFSDTGQTMVAAGTPDLGAGVTVLQGIAMEIVITLLLSAAFLGTAGDGNTSRLGGLSIGLTVTAGILAAGPISGAAMNPARAFGPALASGHWNHHLAYWIGPLMGGVLAGLVCGRWLMKESGERAG